MNEQREAALTEQRARIIHASIGHMEIFDHILSGAVHVNVSIQHNPNNNVDVEKVRGAIQVVGDKYAKDNPTFEELSDDIFTVVATLYPELDINVSLYNERSDVGFSKHYLNQPL